MILKDARPAVADVRVVEQGEAGRMQGDVYRPLATAAPTIDLLAAWRRDNTSPLLPAHCQGN